MKKSRSLFIALFFTLSFLNACKEALPPINFSGAESLVLIDTCFTIGETGIPEPAYKGILIEDITGVRCVACPNAAEVASEIKEAATTNPVVILGLYPEFPKSLTTPFAGYENLRTEAAQLIGSNIYDFGNILPAGGVNRKLFTGETTINIGYDLWQSKANSIVGEKSIVNLNINKDQVNDTTVRVQANFIFTSAPQANPFYSVFLLEDEIEHPQYYSGGTNEDYIHKHVVRKALTPYNGSPLLSGKANCTEIARGTVVEKGWEVEIPSNVNPQKASIVILVNYNDGDNKEVIQCQELKLK